MSNEFSIWDMESEEELEQAEKDGFLLFYVEFFIEDIESTTTEKTILRKVKIPEDILVNLDFENDMFKVPSSYGSKLKFIKFMKGLGFEYDSCNF